MPGYVHKTLERFEHLTPEKPPNQPYPNAKAQYGAKVQYATDIDNSPAVGDKEKKLIQQVTGTLLYYAQAVDPTLLTALSTIASQQSKPMQYTFDWAKQVLDYVASQKEAILTYKASDMVLTVHSDAGYLNETKAHSRAGGHFYLSNNKTFPLNNGAILNIAQIIKAVMSSAAEAEYGALFINAKEAVYLRNMLEEMGHPQPPTPIQTDNLMAEGFINNKIQAKHTKSQDMWHYWLKCREAQEQFRFFWRPGGLNLADYLTKHHPAAHHQNMRMVFLTKLKDLEELHGRVNSEQSANMTNKKTTDDTKTNISGPQEASCKGVLDDAICTTYRRTTELQLATLASLRRI
jgi:hypothetical protein